MPRLATSLALAATLSLFAGSAVAQDAAQRAQQQLNTEFQRSDALNNRLDAPPSRRAPASSAGSAARADAMESVRPNYLTQQGAPMDNLKGGEFLNTPDISESPRLLRSAPGAATR